MTVISFLNRTLLPCIFVVALVAIFRVEQRESACIKTTKLKTF